MNSVRQLKFEQAEKKGYIIRSYCHPSALVNAKSMGKGNIIFENVTIGPFCEIGDGNIFYPNSNISHHTKVGNFNFIAVSSSVAGDVKIGNCCFLGNNSTTKNGICIADNTLVGAGSYISKDTDPYGVYVPQKSIKLENKKSTDFHL